MIARLPSKAVPAKPEAGDTTVEEEREAPSGAMLWIIAALAVFGLLAATGLYAAVMHFASDAPNQKAAPLVHVRLPSLSERRVLVSLTQEPQTALISKGEAAIAGNGHIPFSRAAIIAATPFSDARARDSERQKAELCMTQAIYYEAGFEPLAGKRAVAQTILNRVRHPAFPHSVCGVVYQGANQRVCQFSFTCDGALARRPAPDAWAEAREVARAALDGYVEKSVGLSTHYHADYVLPRWAPELAKIARIGAHIFYRWPGGWGTPRAFSASYAGVETVPLFDPVRSQSALPAVDYPPVAALPERRAENDVGGRIDVSKGWRPNIPLPNSSVTALSRVYASQSSNSASVAGVTP